MKKVLLSTTVLFFSVLMLSAQNNPKKSTPKPVAKTTAPVLKNLLDSFSYAAGINIATNMKAQGISNLNKAIMQKAIEDVFNNKPQLLTAEVNNNCIQRQMEIFTVEKNEAEKARGIAFLEANKKRNGVITLPDGLQYEVLKNGDANAASPKPVDTVVVNYIGRLVDGSEFNNSYKGGQPAVFTVGGVIKGWSEILQLMKPGDLWKVFIPAELAYGAAGNGQVIPPNAALVFEILLETVRPVLVTEAPKNN